MNKTLHLGIFGLCATLLAGGLTACASGSSGDVDEQKFEHVASEERESQAEEASPSQVETESGEAGAASDEPTSASEPGAEASAKEPDPKRRMPPDVQAEIVHCERVRVRSSNPTKITVEALAAEDGYAEVFELDDEIVRIRGGLLFPVSRLRFDYIYRDGELLCAEETVSNVQVTRETEEDWPHFWSHQHVVFPEDRPVWKIETHTRYDERRGQTSRAIEDLADSVLRRAQSKPQPNDSSAQDGDAEDASSFEKRMREQCFDQMAEGDCCDVEQNPPPGATPCFNGERP